MKKFMAGVICLLLVGCGEDQDVTVFKNRHLEGSGTDKNIGKLLRDRPMCIKDELIKVNDLFQYTCTLAGYENVVKEIIVRRSAEVEKEDKPLINQYKEELEVANFKLEQLRNLESAFEELEINDTIIQYNDLFNNFTLPLNKVDPIGTSEYSSFIFDNLDYTLDAERKSVITIIKSVALKYGVTEEFHKHVYLLEYSKEKRKEVLEKEKESIIRYSTLSKEQLDKIKKEIANKLEILARFTYDLFIKELSQNVTFKVEGDVVKIASCTLEYKAFDNKEYSLRADDYCDKMLYENALYEKHMPYLLELIIKDLLKEKNL